MTLHSDKRHMYTRPIGEMGISTLRKRSTLPIIPDLSIGRERMLSGFFASKTAKRDYATPPNSFENKWLQNAIRWKASRCVLHLTNLPSSVAWPSKETGKSAQLTAPESLHQAIQ